MATETPNISVRKMDEFDIVLSIFNQENLIERVLWGIFKNTTTPFNLKLIFDGCSDKSQKRALAYLKRYRPAMMKSYSFKVTPVNLNETKANNIGFKMCESEFMITLQDDMVINEWGWERRLTYPLRTSAPGNVLAVTSRAALDIESLGNPGEFEKYQNKAAREFGTLSRDIFAVRDIINRGPVAFNVPRLKSLNYLNENYAPTFLDDADICLRGWEQHQFIVGAYWIDYISKEEWGKTREEAGDKVAKWHDHYSRNVQNLKRDHKDYLEKGVKHSRDIEMKEESVDYQKKPVQSFFKAKHSLLRPMRFDKRVFRKVIWKNKLRAKRVASLFK